MSNMLDPLLKGNIKIENIVDNQTDLPIIDIYRTLAYGVRTHLPINVRYLPVPVRTPSLTSRDATFEPAQLCLKARGRIDE